jgi:hypothetical protein
MVRNPEMRTIRTKLSDLLEDGSSNFHGARQLVARLQVDLADLDELEGFGLVAK